MKMDGVQGEMGTRAIGVVLNKSTCEDERSYLLYYL